MTKKHKLKSEVVQEIWKSSNEPEYFIEKFCKVRHPSRGLVDFNLYDYQKVAVTNFAVHDRVIVNKARQLGFSTLTAAFIVWLILFHKDKKVLIISINANVAKEMIDKIKVMLRNLPDWLYLADFSTNRAHKIELTNGSSVESIARSDDAGRSYALSLLVIDEAAIIRGMDEMWKGLKSTVSTGGKIIALSTPKGLGNWFHKTYSEAVVGENDWHPMLTNWWECPEYSTDLTNDPQSPGGKTSSWFRKFTQDMTKMQIAQELLTSFIETGDTYFDSETIKFWNDQARDPIAREGFDKNFWIWKQPDLNHQYLISADCSTGAGEDFSTFHVIDLKTLEVVGEYKGKVYPDIFAEILMDAGRKYNNAWLAPESANVGSVTCYQIKNAKDPSYDKLVYLTKDFKLTDKWAAEYNGILPGVPTDVRNRNAMVAKLEECLRKKYITIFSKRFINEMHTFAIVNGKPQAIKADGSHDDLIMGLAIGCWLRDIIPEFSGFNNVADISKLYDSITIAKQTFNQRHNDQQMRIHEIKRKLEEQGFQNLQPHVFNPHIYFSK